MPTLRDAVLRTAIPEPFNAAVPSVELPSRKVTVPEGTRDEPKAATLAVKVTVWPLVAGLMFEASVVTVVTGAGD